MLTFCTSRESAINWTYSEQLQFSQEIQNGYEEKKTFFFFQNIIIFSVITFSQVNAETLE
jgi:hypothetical protein